MQLQPLQPLTPAAAPAAGEPDLQAALARVEALDALLHDEFDALRERRFERLDQMQAAKVALLESLQATADQVAALPEPPALWATITQALAASRDTFRRNEQLVARQAQVVRNALHAMQASEPTAGVDLYDRLGQMARRGGRRIYSEA